MSLETSPTVRVLRVLELLQRRPGVTAEQLGAELGVTARAARRHVALLREAGVPVESTRGPYGGYRVGRGVRPPPLHFTTTEALALVVAVLEGPHPTSTLTPVGSALAKFLAVLPEPVARAAEMVRSGSARGRDPDDTTPDPGVVAALVHACDARRRVLVGYRRGPDRVVDMQVDPWGVVVRRGRWFLVCWSHPGDGVRTLRVDRIESTTQLDDPTDPPADLDPLALLEDQLAQAWSLPIRVDIEAPLGEVRLSRSLGRLEPIDDRRTRLVASTDDPDWYAEQLVALRVPFRVVGPPELTDALRRLGERLIRAAG